MKQEIALKSRLASNRETIPFYWVLATFLGAAIIGVLISIEQDTLWSLFIAVPFVIAIFVKPEISLWALFVLTLILDWPITRLNIFPGNLGLLSDVFILAALGSILLRWISGKQPLKRTVLDWPILLYIVIIAASDFVNTPSPEIFVNGLRRHLKFILYFYVIVNFPPQLKWQRLFIMGLIVFSFVQVPLTILQRSLGFQRDFVSGTISGTQVLMMILLTVIMFLFALYLQGSIRISWMVVCMTLLIPPVIGEARAVFFFAPIAFLFLLFQIGKVPLKYLFWAVPVGVLAFWLAYTFFPTPGNLVVFIENPSLILESESGIAKSGRLGRFEVIRYSVDFLRNSDWVTMLIGTGAGNASPSRLTGGSGALNLANEDFVLDQHVISYLLLELGVLGLCAFGWILFEIYRQGLRVYKQNEDPFWKAVGMMGVSMVLIYGMGSIYKNWLVNDSTMLVFVGVAAILVTQKDLLTKNDESSLPA